ncbi:unnamed protein product [Psylliodes chrysocephalus]|uniref:BPTI/Kunitz inhibitor domain-containing protein n=1 Tax=Psylliodes chrysocephalus TaxID=3402493 RepID=A0A9P0CPU1_9CUCU|nr:unnamed protein product [Psylliodes chrysocephala]
MLKKTLTIAWIFIVCFFDCCWLFERRSGVLFSKEDCYRDIQRPNHACWDYTERFKWDTELQDCVLAVYGGCHPTKNNFHTRENCTEIAKPVCQKLI